MCVNPHSPQPFAIRAGSTGTAALSTAICGTDIDGLLASLRALAQLPSHAAKAFTVANELALGGDVSRVKLAALKRWCRDDPLNLLGVLDEPYLVESRATLILVPASLISQWQAELLRWAPHLAVVTYPGKDRALMNDVFGDSSTMSGAGGNARKGDADAMLLRRLRMLAALAAADVVLAPHGSLDEVAKPALSLLTRGAATGAGSVPETTGGFLVQINWHRIIVDEVQHVGRVGDVGAGPVFLKRAAVSLSGPVRNPL